MSKASRVCIFVCPTEAQRCSAYARPRTARTSSRVAARGVRAARGCGRAGMPIPRLGSESQRRRSATRVRVSDSCACRWPRRGCCCCCRSSHRRWRTRPRAEYAARRCGSGRFNLATPPCAPQVSLRFEEMERSRQQSYDANQLWVMAENRTGSAPERNARALRVRL